MSLEPTLTRVDDSELTMEQLTNRRHAEKIAEVRLTIDRMCEDIQSTYSPEVLKQFAYDIDVNDEGQTCVSLYISDDKPIEINKSTTSWVTDVEGQIKARVLRKTLKKSG